MSAVMKCNAHLIWHGFIGFSLHEALPPPYMATIPFSPSISFHTLFGTRLGALPSWSVRGIGNIPMLGRGNDSGLIVPHIHLTGQLDPLNLLTILFGSSEVFMGASAVRIPVDDMMSKLPGAVGDFMGDEEQAIGTCLFPGPVSLNVGCSSPFLIPGDFVIAPNTVQVGISLADILFALFMYVLSAIIDGLMQGFTSGKWTPDSAIKDTGEKLGKRAAREFIIEKGFAKRIVKQAMKDALEEQAAGLIVDAVMEGWGEEGLENLSESLAGDSDTAARTAHADTPQAGPSTGDVSTGDVSNPGMDPGAADPTATRPGGTGSEAHRPAGGEGVHTGSSGSSSAGRPLDGTPSGPGASGQPTPVSLRDPSQVGGRPGRADLPAGVPGGIPSGAGLPAAGLPATEGSLAAGPGRTGGLDPEALRKARLARLNALGEDLPIERVEATAKQFLSGVFGGEAVDRQWGELRSVIGNLMGHGRSVGGVPGVQGDEEGEDFWGGAWSPEVCE